MYVLERWYQQQHQSESESESDDDCNKIQCNEISKTRCAVHGLWIHRGMAIGMVSHCCILSSKCVRTRRQRFVFVFVLCSVRHHLDPVELHDTSARFLQFCRVHGSQSAKFQIVDSTWTWTWTVQGGCWTR